MADSGCEKIRETRATVAATGSFGSIRWKRVVPSCASIVTFTELRM